MEGEAEEWSYNSVGDGGDFPKEGEWPTKVIDARIRERGEEEDEGEGDEVVGEKGGRRKRSQKRGGGRTGRDDRDGGQRWREG